MGAGKSTLLKKIMSDYAMKGYKIRGFDITGEFEDIVHEYNGKQIALMGHKEKLIRFKCIRRLKQKKVHLPSIYLK